MKKLFFSHSLFLLLLVALAGNLCAGGFDITPSGCTHSSSFGSATINTNGSVATISSCSYAGEYATISGAVSGQTLKFTSSVGSDYITIRSGTYDGTVLAFGQTPLTFSNSYTGTIYAHWSSNSTCGSASTCRMTTVQCTSCAAHDPCTGITNLACSVSTSATISSGDGAYSPPSNSCGFSTPGKEKIYTFTPSITGSHQIVQTTGYNFIDYFYKASSGGCSGTGWTCIAYLTGSSTSSSFTLTAGTQYYIMLDPETTTGGTATFSISCPGNQPPVASCRSLVVAANSVCQSTVPASAFNNGSSDPNGDSLTYSASPASPYSLGTTNVTLTASDSSGATSTCSATITVNDSTFPQIACPSNRTVTLSTGCSGPVNSINAPISDNCSANKAFTSTGATVYPNTAGNASGAVFNSGITTVTYRATDGSGNSVTCSFTITVRDGGVPTIVCPSGVTTNIAGPTQCSNQISGINGTASDNCPGVAKTFWAAGATPIPMTSGDATGRTFNAGVTTVTYMAQDASGQSATCSFNVRVIDNQPPVALCKANKTVNLKANGSVSLPVNQVNNGSYDNCGNIVSLVTNVPGNGSFGCSNTGNNTVKLTVTDDAGLTGTCTMRVTVRDNAAPVAKCANRTYTLLSCGSGCGTRAVPGNSVNNNSTDNCSISLYTTTPNTFSCANLNTINTVRLTVTDPSGNTSTCTAVITITDPNNYCPGAPSGPVTANDQEAEAPAKTSLGAFPNPFNDFATIQFSVEESQKAVLKIFSIAGTEVATLFDSQAEAGGLYSLEFRPEGFSNGIYIAKLETGNGEVKYEKLVLQK